MVVVGTAAVVEAVDIVVVAEVVGTAVVGGFAADNDAVVEAVGIVVVVAVAAGGGFGTAVIVAAVEGDFADVVGGGSADAAEDDFADVGGGSGIAVVAGDEFDIAAFADAAVGVGFYIVGSADVVVEVDFDIVGAADAVVGVDFDIVEPGLVFVAAVNVADVETEVFVSPSHLTPEYPLYSPSLALCRLPWVVSYYYSKEMWHPHRAYHRKLSYPSRLRVGLGHPH